jgi:hypothetical protein
MDWCNDCQHQSRKITALIHFIWTDMTDALWKTWNDLVHHHCNLTDLATEDELADRWRWYLVHHWDVLALSDYFLLADL